MLTFPNIDPVALEIGPIALRWYSLAYIFGILGGYWLATKMNKRANFCSPKQFEGILNWVVLGIVLGGRLGYVLFYKPIFFLANPEKILAIWEGGMSFHGGMIGCILGIYFFCRINKIMFFPVMDVAAVVACIGLFFGRLANFINGELFGRITNSPLGMVFPHGGPYPRHPSQLYEAFGEGIIMFAILSIMFWRFNAWKYPRLLSGSFLILYAIARSTAELFREPDENLGFIMQGITMGQILCAPMFLFGLFLIFKSSRGR